MTDEAKQALDPNAQPAWAIEATIAVAEYLEDAHGIEISAEDGVEINKRIRMAVESGTTAVSLANYFGATHSIIVTKNDEVAIIGLISAAVDRYPGL